MTEVAACSLCGLVQQVESPPRGWVCKCPRCGFTVRARKPDSASRTLAFALGALILYAPANLLPIVQVEYKGMHEKTTIFAGITGLFHGGSYFVGILVFMTSILTPGFKIAGLLLLSLTTHLPKWQLLRTWTYRIVQIVDPWNMLEVTLLAFLVGIAQLGKFATVQPGAGVFSFGGVVVLTICATLAFDPRLVWDTKASKHHDPA